MFKQLKLKFVMINMLFMFIMIIIVFASVYIATANGAASDSFMILDRIIVQSNPPDMKMKLPKQVNMPYFVVDIPVGQNGSYDYSAMTIIRDMPEGINLDEDHVKNDIVPNIMKRQQLKGVVGDYRYMLRTNDNSIRIAFVDISLEKSIKRKLVGNAVLIGGASLIAIFLISMYLASKSIKPVEDAFMSQKRFIADASHELKTPITVILASTNLLKDKNNTRIERDNWVDNIDYEAKRMKSLTDQLLYLAKTENMPEQENWEKVDLSESILNEVLVMESLFFEKGKEIEYDIEEDLIVYGNKEQICRLMVILLDNALKYSDEGSTIKVQLKADSRSKVKLSVKNIGETVDDEHLENVFDRFFQADLSRTDSSSYGLGLPIAKSIVTVHKGKIWATSDNGETAFYVILPRII